MLTALDFEHCYDFEQDFDLDVGKCEFGWGLRRSSVKILTKHCFPREKFDNELSLRRLALTIRKALSSLEPTKKGLSQFQIFVEVAWRVPSTRFNEMLQNQSFHYHREVTQRRMLCRLVPERSAVGGVKIQARALRRYSLSAFFRLGLVVTLASVAISQTMPIFAADDTALILQAEMDEERQLIVSFVPPNDTVKNFHLYMSTDLEIWKLVAFRKKDDAEWTLFYSTGVSVAPDSGEVSVAIPHQGGTEMFAKIVTESGATGNIDLDSNGVIDRLEAALGSVSETTDSDGDGLADRFEILTGRDPNHSEFRDEQVRQRSLASGLDVFTPIAEG